jgi:hypothetical protein
MNRSGAKVNKTQLKEGEKCLTDYQKGKLTTSFEACISADRRGKVQKAKNRTEQVEGEKCAVLANPPLFAYTDAATVNQTAVDEALVLAHRIFGDPVDDADLFSQAADKAAAKCQMEMLKRAAKIEGTVLKAVNKAKKRALKETTDNSALAFEMALLAVFLSDDKITGTEEKLMNGVDKKCARLQIAPDAIFPGACAKATLSEIESCVIAAARCAACSKVNAFDAQHLDCDQADDRVFNGSCP